MTESKNWVTLKVPEEVRDEVRQIVQEQAPGGTTYGDCLLAGAKALAEENETPDPPVGYDSFEDALSDIASSDGVFAPGEPVDFEPHVDAEEIAAEVWARADYAELSEQVARRIREELQG